MRTYETILISRPDGGEEKRQKALGKFQDLIKKGKGKLEKQDDWGIKRLAYPIQKFDKGFYTYLLFNQDEKYISEMERNLKLDENILKYITVIYEAKKQSKKSVASEAAE